MSKKRDAIATRHFSAVLVTVLPSLAPESCCSKSLAWFDELVFRGAGDTGESQHQKVAQHISLTDNSQDLLFAPLLFLIYQMIRYSFFFLCPETFTDIFYEVATCYFDLLLLLLLLLF